MEIMLDNRNLAFLNTFMHENRIEQRKDDKFNLHFYSNQIFCQSLDVTNNGIVLSVHINL
jgi:hypothetical protein